jgi:imidazolonepropionase-like amidohydrolase
MILECIELGVDVIDHGDEVDEACVDAMAKAGTFWVPSVTLSKAMIDIGWDGDGAYAKSYKLLQRVLPLAQKAGVRILVGDDYSGFVGDLVKDDPLDHQVGNYGREFAFYAQMTGLSAAEVLSWGTKNAGELLVDGPERAGVIAAGAVADLIVVDGDPTADLSLLARPNDALKAVIRDGVVVIDRLAPVSTRKAA